jgi:hypothetical protein
MRVSHRRASGNLLEALRCHPELALEQAVLGPEPSYVCETGSPAF